MDYINKEFLTANNLDLAIIYTVEYTSDKKVLHEIEQDGNFENVVTFKYNDLQSAVEEFIRLQDGNINSELYEERNYYLRLFKDTRINGITVAEECINNLPYNKQTLKELQEFKEVERLNKKLMKLYSFFQGDNSLQEYYTKKTGKDFTNILEEINWWKYI